VALPIWWLCTQPGAAGPVVGGIVGGLVLLLTVSCLVSADRTKREIAERDARRLGVSPAARYRAQGQRVPEWARRDEAEGHARWRALGRPAAAVPRAEREG
jgi:hypothetical protein